jgi:hypothetical protein
MEALGTVDGDEVCIVVHDRSGQRTAAGHEQGRDPAARVVRGLREDLEADRLHEISDLRQLEGDAEIRAVAAETCDRLGVGHAGEGVREWDLQHPLEQLPHQRFHDPHDVAFLDEGHLHVELGELRLPIRAQILVAEAAHDLVVAIHARHHQQLLEDLRRLGEREEGSLVHAARYEVIPGAFRRRLREHGRLDVDETLIVQELADPAGDQTALEQPVLHHRAAQIHVAIAQTGLLVDVVLVELEGRSLGSVQHRQRVAENLHPAGHHLRIDGPLGTLPDTAFHPQHELAAHVLGGGEGLFGVGVEDHLHDAFPIPQIDEDHAAVVTAPVHPAAQHDLLAEQVLGDLTAIVASHRM